MESVLFSPHVLHFWISIYIFRVCGKRLAIMATIF